MLINSMILVCKCTYLLMWNSFPLKYPPLNKVGLELNHIPNKSKSLSKICFPIHKIAIFSRRASPPEPPIHLIIISAIYYCFDYIWIQENTFVGNFCSYFYYKKILYSELHGGSGGQSPQLQEAKIF